MEHLPAVYHGGDFSFTMLRDYFFDVFWDFDFAIDAASNAKVFDLFHQYLLSQKLFFSGSFNIIKVYLNRYLRYASLLGFLLLVFFTKGSRRNQLNLTFRSCKKHWRDVFTFTQNMNPRGIVSYAQSVLMSD